MSAPIVASKVDKIGVPEGEVNVSIGARFLELFSEHLYPSANKAFEELVANSWDAGANTVYVGLDDDLSREEAAAWVLDDGESMDFEGLQMLWAIATSGKRNLAAPEGRRQIGKFGVGKLATYILARELTYICKASDGIIRAVAMDYDQIKENPNALHLEQIPLSVRKLSEDELQEVLDTVPNGKEIGDLIEQGIPRKETSSDYSHEFSQNGGGHTTSSSDTWTLALLSSLKPIGRELQHGRIRWILSTALPLGSSISLVFNGEPILSSKIGIDVAQQWTLGNDLDIDSVEVDRNYRDSEEVTAAYEVAECTSPEPHVTIEGVEGEITGHVLLYEDRISGGKSDAIGSSNGFFVNIRGRVINIGNPDFGLENLSHTAWSKFRATVRADGLDQYLGVNREDLQDTEPVRAFQAFLRTLFNKARTAHDAAEKASWPEAGDVLQDSWHSVPLEPLRQVVSEGLGGTVGLPSFIDASGVEDDQAALVQWEEIAQETPGNLITDVEFQLMSRDEHLVKYDLSSRKVIVNTQHPFYLEYGDTLERKLLLRDTALVELLTNAYMVDIGLDWEQFRRIREYRDQAFRLMARVSRRSGPQLAELLLEARSSWRGLEVIVSDALYYLSFDVEPIGGKSEPDGVATALLTPTAALGDGEDEIRRYKFTYDTKYSDSGKVKTGNLSIAGLSRHRKKHQADHVLVIAPNYEGGEKLLQECKENSITPMRASDLGKLLMLTAANGPLDLEAFRTVFDLTDPDQVQEWVSDTISKVESSPSPISYDLLLRALEDIGYSTPDAVHITLIADRVRQIDTNNTVVNKQNVRNILAGLSVLVPNLVQLTNEGNVFLSTSPRQLREAVRRQVSSLPDEYQFGLDSLLD